MSRQFLRCGSQSHQFTKSQGWIEVRVYGRKEIGGRARGYGTYGSLFCVILIFINFLWYLSPANPQLGPNTSHTQRDAGRGDNIFSGQVNPLNVKSFMLILFHQKFNAQLTQERIGETTENIILELLVLDHHGAGLEGVFTAKPAIPYDALPGTSTIWVSVVHAIKMCIVATEN